MARAMGGRCVNDLPNAEVGTIELRLTDVGRADPLFGQLPATFLGQAGHEDHVVALPTDAVLLASWGRVAEQAFRFADRPIYCTQFHPELDRAALIQRVQAYPEYVERSAGMAVRQVYGHFKRVARGQYVVAAVCGHDFSVNYVPEPFRR